MLLPGHSLEGGVCVCGVLSIGRDVFYNPSQLGSKRIGWLIEFYCISSLVGYLMPNPVYTEWDRKDYQCLYCYYLALGKGAYFGRGVLAFFFSLSCSISGEAMLLWTMEHCVFTYDRYLKNNGFFTGVRREFRHHQSVPTYKIIVHGVNACGSLNYN